MRTVGNCLAETWKQAVVISSRPDGHHHQPAAAEQHAPCRGQRLAARLVAFGDGIFPVRPSVPASAHPG
ncbi:hypothetical protein ACFQU2_27450 [Siccirubricoccus deserti]